VLHAVNLGEPGVRVPLNTMIGNAAIRAAAWVAPVAMPGVFAVSFLSDPDHWWIALFGLAYVILTLVYIEWGLSRRTVYLKEEREALAAERTRLETERERLHAENERAKQREESLDTQARGIRAVGEEAKTIAGNARVEVERLRVELSNMKGALLTIDERTRVLDMIKDRYLPAKPENGDPP